MSDHASNTTRSAQEQEDEKAVQSIPLDTESGGTVVIEQQNMGGSQQVGGGEYKNAGGKRSVEEAAAEQAELERDAPIHDGADGEQGGANGSAGLDPDAPGVSVLGLQPGQPVENNEPA